MTREKEYNALIERLNNPQNAELRNRLAQTSHGFDLEFHIKRINTYVQYEKSSNCAERDLLELDYSVSLTVIKKMMDEQGWK